MKTYTSVALSLIVAYTFFNQTIIGNRVIYDGTILACFQIAYANHKKVVKDKKYQPLDNYHIEFIEKKDTVWIVFDPKKDEDSKEIILGGVSPKGLGFQYLVDKKTKKILQTALVP